MTEQQIQKGIVNLIEKDYKGYVVKVMVASRSGVPDLVCCVRGRFIAIEVKKPSSKTNVSKLQEYNLGLVDKAGGVAIVAWSVEMVANILEGLD